MERQPERYQLYRQILWDYNYSPEEVEEVLSGKKERIGHLDKQALFVRLLESYNWFTLLRLYTPRQMLVMLTPELIGKLKTSSLKERYNYVQKRLQQIVYHAG